MGGSSRPDASAIETKRSKGLPTLKMPLKARWQHDLPMLAYGIKPDESHKIEDLVAMAIKNGYYNLDLSECTPSQEAEFGPILEKVSPDRYLDKYKFRNKLFLTMKLPSLHVTDVKQQFTESYSRVSPSWVNMYLLPAPRNGISDRDLQKAWADLEMISRTGGLQIGVSDFTRANLETILATAKIPPMMNRVEKDIAVMGYGPLSAPTDASRRIAAVHNVTEADVAMRWCIDQGMIAVTSSTNGQRLQGYVKHLSSFELAPREIEAISEEGEQMKHYEGCKWSARFTADRR
ncbi:Aldo/keto reductase [Xylariaceae sp. FL0255]|nr:Aldo/keto reductase [Xylariaceae sp. FL0255]